MSWPLRRLLRSPRSRLRLPRCFKVKAWVWLAIASKAGRKKHQHAEASPLAAPVTTATLPRSILPVRDVRNKSRT